MATTLTRRTVLKTGAAAGAALAAPFVRGPYAAGTLSLRLLDDWVPTPNEPMRKIC